MSLQDLVDDMCPADREHVEDVVPVGTTLCEVTHSPDVSFDVLVPLTLLGKQGTGFLPIRCVRHLPSLLVSGGGISAFSISSLIIGEPVESTC